MSMTDNDELRQRIRELESDNTSLQEKRYWREVLGTREGR